MRGMAGTREKTLLLPEGSRLDEVLDMLKDEYPRMARMIDCSIVALNDEYTVKQRTLKDGDTVSLIPGVSEGERVMRQ
jgi:molybdopterin synthase sulfur carrier subunit